MEQLKGVIRLTTKDIVFLTTTFYKTVEDIRFNLACQTIGNAVGLGYDILVVDGSPDTKLLDQFRRIGATVIREKSSGIGESRRQLFRWALELTAKDNRRPIWVWLEPEKTDLVRWIPTIIRPIESNLADIVIVGRTEESWKTYPDLQVKTEQAGNLVYASITGRQYDAMMGPIAMAFPVLEKYFANCHPKEQYGAPDNYINHTGAFVAMANGCRVGQVLIDFLYPLAQRHEEEGTLRDSMIKKRKWQLKEMSEMYLTVAIKLNISKQN